MPYNSPMSSIDLLKNVVKSLDSLPDLKKEVLAINKTFQFNVSDGTPFYVTIGDGQVAVENGTKQPASATITASTTRSTSVTLSSIVPEYLILD